MFKWFQRYSAAGGAVWISAKITHDWAVVVSMLAGFSSTALAYWEWGTRYGYTPIVLVGLLAVTVVVWLINGIRALVRRGTPTKPKMSFDYAYGLALTAMHIGKDEKNEQGYYQAGVIWRNSGPAALQYHVDHFRVIIGTRTVNAPYNRDGIIARDCHTIFFYPPFSKKDIDDLGYSSNGVVEYDVRYGHPEHGFLRRVKARLNVTFRLDDKAGAVYLIDELRDEELKA
jgi:hypothetical protein